MVKHFFTVRWRDNNRRVCSEKQIDIGDIGETECFRRLIRNGEFRSRTTEIVISDPVPIAIAGVDEIAEVKDV